MTPACSHLQSRAGGAGSPGTIVLVAAERDEVYAGLTLSPAPSAEPLATLDTWEWTLWRSAAAQCDLKLDDARWSLIVSALELAEDCGVSAFRLECEADFLPQLVELGWAPRPLDLPRPSSAGAVITVTWRFCPGQLEEARARLQAGRTADRRSLAQMDVLGCA